MNQVLSPEARLTEIACAEWGFTDRMDWSAAVQSEKTWRSLMVDVIPLVMHAARAKISASYEVALVYT